MSSGLPPFENEPVLELRRAPVRAGLSDALEALDRSLPLQVPVLVGPDQRAPASDRLLSTDPGAPERIVAIAARATDREVSSAVAVASEAFKRWRGTPAAER